VTLPELDALPHLPLTHRDAARNGCGRAAGIGHYPELTSPFADAQDPQGVARDHGRVIELDDAFAAAVVLLTVAVFAAMIWAGNHSH
jgi:hypothetical protein